MCWWAQNKKESRRRAYDKKAAKLSERSVTAIAPVGVHVTSLSEVVLSYPETEVRIFEPEHAAKQVAHISSRLFAQH